MAGAHTLTRYGQAAAVFFAVAALGGCGFLLDGLAGRSAHTEVTIRVGLGPSAAFLGTYTDVTTITVDAFDDTTTSAVAATGELTDPDGDGIWAGTISGLVVGYSYTFTAYAFNVSGTEIFTGTSTQTAISGGSTVSIRLDPVPSPGDVTLPIIQAIYRPGDVLQTATAEVTVSVQAASGALLQYSLNTPAGGGGFASPGTSLSGCAFASSPLYTGSLTLTSSTGQFQATYCPGTPGIHTGFVASVTNAAGYTVSNTFNVTVIEGGTGSMTVQFSPVITAILGKRLESATPGTLSNNVRWTATVVDNDLPPYTYSWSWTPATGTTDSVSFVDAAVNPVTMTGYAQSVGGTLTLTVTDSAGGATTVNYPVPVGQFPDSPVTTADGVALFANTSYVDYGTSSNNEAGNLEDWIDNRSHAKTVFTGITASDFVTATSGRKVLMFPELERADLNPALSSAARTAIASFVSSGGRVFAFYPNGRMVSLLNAVFGFSLSNTGTSTSSLNSTDVSGTSFADGPASLPAHSATTGILTSSLPTGSRSMYVHSTKTSVAVIPHGSGWVIVLGWDWFNAYPRGATGETEWIPVLDNAMAFD